MHSNIYDFANIAFQNRWEFKLDEADCGTKVVLDVAVSKFLDTSLMDIDVQPLLIRVLIKGKLLQLHLPAEVSTKFSSNLYQIAAVKIRKLAYNCKEIDREECR